MRIVTVGAGPCGLYASRLLQDMGHDVTVLEEHLNVGTPMQCAGLVGKEFLSMMGSDNVINEINGASIYYGNSHFTLERKGVAYVLDRCSFDRSLEGGVNVIKGGRVRSIVDRGTGYQISTHTSTYDADMVIGADGPASLVRKTLNFPNNVRIYPAYQECIRCEPTCDDMVIVDIKRPFFSWIIPSGEGMCRVGTIGPKTALESLKRKFFIKKEAMEKIQAPVPIGKSQLACRNAVLIGDAAAQTKPLSGGGLLYGMKAAEFLAESIRKNDISDYEKQWNNCFGKEIRFGMRMRSFYESLSEDDLQKIFSILHGKRDQIEKNADFDRHSSLIKLLITSPSLVALIGKYLPKVI